MVEQSNDKKICQCISYLLIVPFCTVIVIALSGAYFNFTPSDFLVKVTNNLYQPHHNIFRPAFIAGINFYGYVYLIFFLSFVLSCGMNLVLRRKKADIEPKAPSVILHSTMIATYALVITIQTMSFLKYAHKELRTFSGKSTEEKYASVIGGKTFIFAQYCKAVLSGAHNAEFMTDMDLSQDPGMLTHRMLAYYLYPIDIRKIRGGSSDSLIIFAKRNAVKNVPEDFEILAVYNNENVIAVKKYKSTHDDNI